MTADPAGGDLPAAAYAAALASVTTLGPRRLRRFLEECTPRRAWESVRDGRAEDPGGRWRRSARQLDVSRIWAAHRDRDIDVALPGDPSYPGCLATDPEAPAVLFTRGDPAVLDRHPRVALVGTRTPTRYGLGMAAQLGTDLASSGVVVVSGLALGIDGAAHEGAAGVAGAAGAAPPVGVVAGGLDAPYPPSHARLWRRVADAGALVSESPVGVPVPRWRFPQRNRILAAVSHVVVVVECHQRGGSLHTVRAAVRRGRAVGAVPGSVRSPASAGTNDLLADGCFVVRDTADVLVAVELARAHAVAVRPRVRRAARGARPTGSDVPEPAGPDAGGSPTTRVWQALGWEPCALEDLLRRTDLPLAAVAAALDRLEGAGRARGENGWWERV